MLGVCARAHELARLTGMAATQVVEDALRAYVPAAATAKSGRLVQRGPLLVRPGLGDPISLEAANEALEQTRTGDLDRESIVRKNGYRFCRAFAHEGGIGARLYDRLIGEAALTHEQAIITWNVGNMRSLFPSLETLSPVEFLQAS